ncbi:MAG: hypothetical protein H7X71_01735 [Chitinophagales bacterium]|nr:hypothetical protein [Chitinophagales bacterium]
MKLRLIFTSPILPVFIFAGSLSISGCSSNSTSGNDIHQEEVSAQKRFVYIDDATQILPEWSTENIIVNHVVGEADHLHPFNSVNATKTWVHNYIHNFILRADLINLELTPDLAVSLPDTSADGLEYTYTLRKDATWDDGSPVTVEDVIFSYKACRSPLTNNPNIKAYVENLKDVTADPADPQKFTMVMKTTWIQNVIMVADIPVIQRSFYDPGNILANYSFLQFDDPDFLKKAGKDIVDWNNNFNNVAKYGNDPAFIKGAGPYQVAEWNRGQTLILEKKKNHWTGKVANPDPYETAYPEKIIFKIISDDNATKLELTAQNVDVSTWLTTKSLLELQNDSAFNRNYNAKFNEQYGYNYIAMNMKPDGINNKKFFTDAKVRRAMANLTPVDEIIQVISLGKAMRVVSTVSSLKPEYNTDLQLIPFDVEAAKKLLDEAGWVDTDGDNIRDKMIDGEKVQFSFNLGYMTSQTFVGDMAKMISDAMYKAGVQANLKPMDANLLYEETRQHNFDMTMGAWASNSYPEDYTQLWHTSNWANNGSNFSGFGNAESDALIDSMKTTLDTEKRYAMVKRFQKIIYDEQPYIFTYTGYKRIVIHKRFGNQFMTFERPGVVLNYYKLLSLYGMNTGGIPKEAVMM